MSGYNRFEQAIGTVLDRFPRTKSIVETTYQRTNYYIANRGGFRYELHDDVELYSIEEWFDTEIKDSSRFVGFYDICPWSKETEHFLVHERDETGNTSIVIIGPETTSRVATTDAWNYQQGSRLQWHPTQRDQIVFNDLEDDTEVARIVNIEGESVKTYSQLSYFDLIKLLSAH